MTFKRPKIMGIVNVTPDSFSDGGSFYSHDLAIKQSLKLLDEGADIIDIGGESTRPGASEISTDEEIARVLPVIIALRDTIKGSYDEASISIDTRKSIVANAAINAGADIWNDVSGLTFDDSSVDVAADLECPLIIMHSKGLPINMQNNPNYEDVVKEIKNWFQKRIEAFEKKGIHLNKITIDPGLGFGKRQIDNLSILKNLNSFKDFGCPILVGASRKSFIGNIDASKSDDRLGGSIASALWSINKGVEILRVHDVKETIQAIRVWTQIASSN
jgi:dihydropteroate synthase